MKVLIVNSLEFEGGAARAANRLHKGLLSKGVDSQMLVMKKNSDDKTVLSPFSKLEQEYNKLLPLISALPLIKYNKTRKRVLFSPQFMAKNLLKIINDINPDIIHLHWINAGFMDLSILSKIKKPIIWSLHDMWAFTGGCHYSDKCEKYIYKCGRCVILGSKNENDLSRDIYNKKKKIFSHIENMTIIGLSRWLESEAKKSSLLKDKNVINLPNLIDTNIYKPFDKLKARELWNLPKDKKLILFGALNGTSDLRKGFKQLNDAIELINIDNVELVVFGSNQSNIISTKFNTHFIGNLNDDISLVTLYSAVDVMVTPSLQENLSNVIMESLSCATPVVAFEIGGNLDMIEHKKNGYLAKAFESKDLAKGIEFILNEDSNNLKDYARKKIITEFSLDIVVDKYIKLYENFKS